MVAKKTQYSATQANLKTHLFKNKKERKKLYTAKSPMRTIY